MRIHYALAGLMLLLAGCPDADDVGSGTGDTGTTDFGPLPDVSVRDGRVTDPEPVSGQFGDPCERAADCISGRCIEAPQFGKICTRRCGVGAECPEGFECLPERDDADATFICVADRPELCKRCEHDRECDDNADLCLQIGAHRYCGEDCAGDGYCPQGFECTEIRRGEGDAGVTAMQCVPAGNEGCRPCLDNDGDGYGMGEDCLGFDCNDNDPNVYEGAPELCDGKDNNCNSLVDEPDQLVAPPEDIVCLDQGVCRGTRVACLDGRWRCDYPNSFEDGVEVSCDGLDNDCDGTPDDDIDLTSDPRNCAFCGNACRFPNAQAVCTNSACELGECNEGWFNVDGNDGNGCEYGCRPTQEGVELCDGIDNDCDPATPDGAHEPWMGTPCDGADADLCREGTFTCRDGAQFCSDDSGDNVEICDGEDNDCDERVDEGFDFANDVSHCGGCNQPCGFPNAVPGCQAATCVLVGCNPGFYDIDGRDQNGCEYICAPTNGGAEACDQADNDCDGRIDEDFDLLTNVQHCGRCNGACVLPNAVPRCGGGACLIGECQGGFWDIDGRADNGCEYACQPTNGGLEACDSIDNDCDGQIDEDFDFNTNVEHCGQCNRSCGAANGTVECRAGGCVFTGCQPGFYDIDRNPANGCEYACEFRNAVDLPDPDARDDNCDGIDGVAATAVFVAANGDPNGDGSAARPLNSINAGITRAANLGATQVLVSEGSYDETVTVVAGVGIYGGYSRNNGWARNLDAYESRINGRPVGLMVQGINRETRIQGLTIAAGNAVGAGSSSMAVYMRDVPADTVHLTHSLIIGANGANGADGPDGTIGGAGGGGSAGGQGSSGSSGGGGGGSGGASACNGGGGGGMGGYNGGGSDGARGNGNGGAGGAGAGVGCSRRGGDGQVGADGGNGNNGSGGNGNGGLFADQWFGNSGAVGTVGGHGRGGGGGGGGGGTTDCTSCGVPCDLLLGCVCRADRGGGGGGGGGAGCGGTGGGGGQGGGGSFGVFLVRASPVLTANEIRSGRGGAGGAGGRGAAGGTGGVGGGGGGGADDSGAGGTGGRGGRGGIGGHGGGGSGGVSFALYTFQSNPRVGADNLLVPGQGGAGGGSPGNAGSAGVAAPRN